MQPCVNDCIYTEVPYHTENFNISHGGFAADSFFPRRSLFQVWEVICGQPCRHSIIYLAWYCTQINCLFAVVSAWLGTGDLQACCHVYSPFFISVVCGLHHKDQDSEFLFIFIYCHFLGLRNSAEEKLLILLILTTYMLLQIPVAVGSCMTHACGYGTCSMGLPCFRSLSVWCHARNTLVREK